MRGIMIKRYLDENGIKYTFLAEKLGISMNILSPILNGKRKISADEYIEICRVLGLPLEFFANKDMTF